MVEKRLIKVADKSCSPVAISLAFLYLLIGNSVSVSRTSPPWNTMAQTPSPSLADPLGHKG